MILTALVISTLTLSSTGLIEIKPTQVQAQVLPESFLTTKNLNLRTQANYKESTPILTKIPAGALVKRLKVVRNGQTNYAYVNYQSFEGNSYTGYISNANFKAFERSKHFRFTEKNKNFKTIAGGYLRSNPGLYVNNQYVKFAKKDSIVQVRSYEIVNGTKYMMVDFQANVGYVKASNLKEIPDDYGRYQPLENNWDMLRYQVMKPTFLYTSIETANTMKKIDQVKNGFIEPGAPITLKAEQTYKGEKYYLVEKGDRNVINSIEGWVHNKYVNIYKNEQWNK